MSASVAGKRRNESVGSDASRSHSAVSGIRDNCRRGKAGDFLLDKIAPHAQLSVVSAYFTIYAFDALKDHLSCIDHLDFLFGEPRFVNALDPDRTEKKAFIIDTAGLRLVNALEQKRIARECADWIRAKVAIRSVRQSDLLHGKMYRISHNGVEDALVGSSNFTVRGLGLGAAGNNIELNLEVDSNRDRRDLKEWFDEIWNDELVLNAIRQQSGEFRLVDIEHACPGVGRDWIQTLLTEMKVDGELTCAGKGPAARWRLISKSEGSTSK